jgi:hypothetical protein
VIHDFESSPLLIKAHRDYLRSLYRAGSAPVAAGPRRTAPGTLWRRLGQALRRRPALSETPLHPSSGVA